MEGGNNRLYTDDNPKTTIKGTGYSDKKKALKTLKLISKRSIVYQKSVVITMLYRAKHHRNKTDNMKEAIKVYEQWLKKNKNKKRRYEYLKLSTIKKYEGLAKEYGILEIPSVKKFYETYKKYKGNKRKMAFIPVDKSDPTGYDFDSMREIFLHTKLKKIKRLYYPNGKYKGLPTKWYLILIMFAYGSGSILESYLLNHL